MTIVKLPRCAFCGVVLREEGRMIRLRDGRVICGKDEWARCSERDHALHDSRRPVKV